MGRFAVATVSKIVNLAELEESCLKQRRTFSELSGGTTNPTELIAMMIAEADDFVSGIENVFHRVKGSCSMLILTENGLIAARDKLGRTPIVLGKKENAYAAAFETSSFPNLNYETE
jgi:amidophosphoribosyltransferase